MRKLFFTVLVIFSIQLTNAQNGKGTYTSPDGKKYTGEFKDGVLEN